MSLLSRTLENRIRCRDDGIVFILQQTNQLNVRIEQMKSVLHSKHQTFHESKWNDRISREIHSGNLMRQLVAQRYTLIEWHERETHIHAHSRSPFLFNFRSVSLWLVSTNQWIHCIATGQHCTVDEVRRMGKSESINVHGLAVITTAFQCNRIE